MRKIGAIIAERTPQPYTMGNALYSFIDTRTSEYARERERLQSIMNAYKVEAQRATRAWGNAYKTMRSLIEPTVDVENVVRAETLATQLSRHALIESYEVTDRSITVYTRLLFADVAVENGSDRLMRRCIGSFCIEIDPTKTLSNAIKIKNNLFSIGRAHWGVASGHPCWGEFADEIREHLETKNVFALINTVIVYLYTAGDGAAYMRASDFVNERVGKCPIITGSGRVRDKASLLTRCAIARNGLMIEAGTKHRVADTSYGNAVILIGDQRVMVHDSEIIVVRHAIYQRYHSLAQINEKLSAIDGLPLGSTLLQAQNLIKTI